MKIKKIKKFFCKNCVIHQNHNISIFKKSKSSELKKGQRKFRRLTKGVGGFPRPKPSGSKPTKKISLIFKCLKCDYQFHFKGLRSKKIEII